MALIEVNSPAAGFDPACAAKMFPDSHLPDYAGHFAAGPAFSFAVAPSPALTKLPRDPEGGAAFAAPASLVTAVAALSMLRHAIFRNVLPAPVLR